MEPFHWYACCLEAHETAYSKTDVKACLLKHMNKAFHYKTKDLPACVYEHSLLLGVSNYNE